MKRKTAERVITWAETVLRNYQNRIGPRLYRNQEAKIAGAKQLLEANEYYDATGRAFQAIGTIYRGVSGREEG